jgi:hypothetical protein
MCNECETCVNFPGLNSGVIDNHTESVWHCNKARELECCFFSRELEVMKQEFAKVCSENRRLTENKPNIRNFQFQELLDEIKRRYNP